MVRSVTDRGTWPGVSTRGGGCLQGDGRRRSTRRDGSASRPGGTPQQDLPTRAGRGARPRPLSRPGRPRPETTARSIRGHPAGAGIRAMRRGGKLEPFQDPRRATLRASGVRPWIVNAIRRAWRPIRRSRPSRYMHAPEVDPVISRQTPLWTFLFSAESGGDHQSIRAGRLHRYAQGFRAAERPRFRGLSPLRPVRPCQRWVAGFPE